MSKMGRTLLTPKKDCRVLRIFKSKRMYCRSRIGPTHPAGRLTDGQSFLATRGHPEERKWVRLAAEGHPLPTETPESKEVQRVQGSEGRRRGHEGALHQSAGDADQ